MRQVSNHAALAALARAQLQVLVILKQRVYLVPPKSPGGGGAWGR